MDADIQTVILIGHLLTDAESFTDKNGHDFVRFKMTCRRTTFKGETKFTVYRVCCYIGGYETLKQGDQVFVSGELDISVHIDKEGKVWLNNEVYAKQISKGSVENSRIKNVKK